MVSVTGSNPTQEATAFPLSSSLGRQLGAAWLVARQCEIGSVTLNKGELNSPALGGGERKTNWALQRVSRGTLIAVPRGTGDSAGLTFFSPSLLY